MGAGGYAPLYPQHGAAGWLRRNSGLLGLLSVLLLCLIAGLLIGHWATQGKASTAAGPQVVKIEGLGALATGAATSTTPSAGKTAAAKSSAKEEAEEEKEAVKETNAEKAPPAPATKVSSSTLQKLTTSSGKKHEEEINALGSKPIETGG
jgi:hypothetical protein